MKKTLFTLALLLTAMTAWADNNDWHFSINADGTATVICYKHPGKVWINGMEVETLVTDNCYRGDAEIPSVTPEGQTVTGIGNDCFYNCTALTSVKIPNTIKRIGNTAFEYCKKLKEITIPSSVEEMGSNAIWNCDSIERLIIEDSPNTIELPSGYDMFRTLRGLRYIYQGRNMVSLDDTWKQVFRSMNGPVELIEQGPLVTQIAEGEFEDNDSLKTVRLSPNVTVIPKDAFDSCESLETVEAGAVTSIGENAFSNCYALKATPDLSHCKEILGGAFARCKSIERVVIPASVDTLGYGAFWLNESLTELVIEDCDRPLKVGSSGMFRDSDSHIKKAYFGRNAESTSYLQYAIIEDNPSVEEITFAGSCSYLRSSEFAGCYSLKTVRLGKNMKDIAHHAFGWSSDPREQLTTLVCEAVMPPECKDGALQAVDKEKCTLFVPSESIDAYREANEWKDFFNIQPIDREPTLTQEKLFAVQLSDMHTARICHQIMPVDDGFVVFGGHTTGFNMTKTAERYNIATDSWKQMDMLFFQDYAAGIVTQDGKMLLAGGMGYDRGSGANAQCELYDPNDNTFTATGSMTQARSMATATRTKSGKIYINGCWYNSSYGLECYDPETGTFSKAANGLNAYHPLLLALRNERVAICDGSKMVVAEDGVTSDVTSDLLTEFPILKGWDETQTQYYQLADYSYIVVGKSDTQAVLLSIYDNDEEGVKVTKIADLPMTLPDNESAAIGYHDESTRVFCNNARRKVYVQTVLKDDGCSPVIVEYTYPTVSSPESGNIVVYATDRRLEQYIYNAAWTMLPDGTLVSSGGGDSNFAPHKQSYIYFLGDAGYDPDGIEEIQSSKSKIQNEDAVYNLAGQRLSKPQRGINIVNGKKTVIR